MSYHAFTHYPRPEGMWAGGQVDRPPAGAVPNDVATPPPKQEDPEDISNDSSSEDDVVAVPVSRPVKQEEPQQFPSNTFMTNQTVIERYVPSSGIPMEVTPTPPQGTAGSPIYAGRMVKQEYPVPLPPRPDEVSQTMRRPGELPQALAPPRPPPPPPPPPPVPPAAPLPRGLLGEPPSQPSPAVPPAPTPPAAVVAAPPPAAAEGAATQPAKKKKTTTTTTGPGVAVTIPDIDLSDKATFDVVPTSQRFKKWLARCIRNGCATFTRGDASQIVKYASKHKQEYYGLKDGWARLIKGLTDEAELLKAWYAFDCLLRMTEFRNPEVRATLEIKLPDLIAGYMDAGAGAPNREKYIKLVQTWRGRLSQETMQRVRRKMAAMGASLPDNHEASRERRFRFAVGDTTEFLSRDVGEWVQGVVVRVTSSDVTFRLAGEHGDTTLPYSYAAHNTRIPKVRHPRPEGGQRRRMDGKKKRFDVVGESPELA